MADSGSAKESGGNDRHFRDLKDRSSNLELEWAPLLRMIAATKQAQDLGISYVVSLRLPITLTNQF